MAPRRRNSLELILAMCEEDPYTKCLTWTGYTSNGYGRALRKKRLVSVHREAYQEQVGSIPDGAVIHHLCRNKLCVNVHHLVCMENADHVAFHAFFDTHTKQNKNKTHCKYGHEFTDENTYWRLDGTGRHCRTCQTDRYVKYRDREMAVAA